MLMGMIICDELFEGGEDEDRIRMKTLRMKKSGGGIRVKICAG